MATDKVAFDDDQVFFYDNKVSFGCPSSSPPAWYQVDCCSAETPYEWDIAFTNVTLRGTGDVWNDIAAYMASGDTLYATAGPVWRNWDPEFGEDDCPTHHVPLQGYVICTYRDTTPDPDRWYVAFLAITLSCEYLAARYTDDSPPELIAAAGYYWRVTVGAWHSVRTVNNSEHPDQEWCWLEATLGGNVEIFDGYATTSADDCTSSLTIYNGITTTDAQADVDCDKSISDILTGLGGQNGYATITPGAIWPP